MLIATKLVLTSPYSHRAGAVFTAFCRSPDHVTAWAAEKVRRFALRRRLPVLEVDMDITTHTMDYPTVALALAGLQRIVPAIGDRLDFRLPGAIAGINGPGPGVIAP